MARMNKPIEQEVFKAAPYNTQRGRDLALARMRQFAKSPVDGLIDQTIAVAPYKEVIRMCYGDPSRYPDMGPYEGVHRILRRQVNFYQNSRICASYHLAGDEQFITQIRRTSAYEDEDGLIKVPDSAVVCPTSGVAGALRMIFPAILLPPEDGKARHNVVIPKLTYLSHSAEVALAHGEIKSCDLTADGQIDVDDMFRKVDCNTRAIIFATVGNPLSTAMPPELFDKIIARVEEKMTEYGHPIIVIADTIYEQFRRNREEKINPIQRLLWMDKKRKKDLEGDPTLNLPNDVEVPIIDTSSFSKMFGLAGYRVGFYLAYWKENGRFRDERYDFFEALSIVYGPSLDPVPVILQKAIGTLYVAINAREPVAEELAPVAALLTAVKDLTANQGGGDTHTMMPEEVPEEIVRCLGFNPHFWFTSSAVAKRTRKLATGELGKFSVDITSERIETMADKLVKAGYLERSTLSVSRKHMLDILTSAVLKYGNIEHKLIAGLRSGLDIVGKGDLLSESDIDSIVKAQMENLIISCVPGMGQASDDMRQLDVDFGLKDGDSASDNIEMVFYRLTGKKVPDVELRDDETLNLETISEDHAWQQVAKHCGLPREDQLYEEHKRARRQTTYERTDRLLSAIDEMNREGLGVYLHPAYYDKDGNLVPERVNSFYVLFGFERFKGSQNMQAYELVDACKFLGLPLPHFTPGEVFSASEEADNPEEIYKDDSFIRAVTLLPEESMDRVLAIIRKVATYKARGDFIPPRFGRPPPEEDPAIG
ncbi:MAG: pyridoxal phosphate-dependent aminotransferase [Candidatus Micrarchaeota archaeon]